MPSYPGEGQPCNGCGHCCQMKACQLSVELLRSETAPCLALEFAEGRYWCGLVRSPEKLLGAGSGGGYISRVVAQLLGIGRGCDSDGPDGGER